MGIGDWGLGIGDWAISALYVVDTKLNVTFSVNILGNAIKDIINKNFIVFNLNCYF